MKQRQILFFILMIGSAGIIKSQEKVLTKKIDLAEGYFAMYEVSSKAPSVRNGAYTEYLFGNVIVKGSYVNGKKNGEWYSTVNTNPNGSLITYKDGVENGLFYRLYGTGDTFYSGYYANGNMDGVFKRFYDNGKPAEIKHYQNDVRHGTSSIFARNGMAKEISYYTKSIQDSVDQYDSTGHIRSRIRKDERGKILSRDRFDDQGKMLMRIEYKNGTPDHISSCNSSGAKGCGTLNEGNGILYEYFSNGSLRSMTSYAEGKKDGPAVTWFPGGVMCDSGSYFGDGKTDLWTFYYTSGKIKERATFNGGNRYGPDTVFYPSGKIRRYGNFSDDHLTGEWIHYNEDGTLLKRENFTPVKKSQNTSGNNNIPTLPPPPPPPPPTPGGKPGEKSIWEFPDNQFSEFEMVWEEVNPSFPGGETALLNFIKANVRYPKKARKKNIQGTVWIGFTIGKTGKIEDVRVVRSVHEMLDAESIRVLKLMPDWTPGMMNGKPVRCTYQVPLGFKLR